MVDLPSLWLPIVLSAVFVFIVSSVIHVALPLHRKDWDELPSEDSVLEAMRQAGTQPGNYYFPHVACQDMKSEESKNKRALGPVGFMIVHPSGPPAMGKALGSWFAFTLVVGVFVAYLASRTLDPGEHYLRVFQVVGAAAFLAYSMGPPVESIWKGVKWSTSLKFVVDGLAYALVTAGTFGWLWPAT